MGKLTVNLVTWNGEKYIPFLFESLRRQSFKDWELVIIDNHSSDGTVEAIQKELINFPVSTRLIVNKENVGFAGGHNQAFLETREELCLIINQDLYLEKDCLEKLVIFFINHSEAAAVAPRIMKWNFANNEFTDKIDSLGLKIFRNRRVVEIGEGEVYRCTGTTVQEVFGVSGAVAAFRRSDINQIGFFDDSFNSYKEDVDLAFRIQSAGFKSFVLMDAVAYHDRAGGGTKHKDDYSSALNKNKQRPLVRNHSYKNHLATLYKNEYWQNFILDLPWIGWYELKKFIYFLIFDRAVLKGLGDLWKSRSRLSFERAKIKELRKISWKEIRKWWK